MPFSAGPPLIPLDDASFSMLRNACVLTGNNRLAGHLASALQQRLAASGEQGWRTPAVYGVSAFCERFVAVLGPDAPALIEPAGVGALYRGQDVGSEHSPPADAFRDAFDLIDRYRIDASDPSLMVTGAGRRFARDRARVAGTLRDAGGVTYAQLPGWLADTLRRPLAEPVAALIPDRIVLVGFERIDPSLGNLIDALTVHGTSIERLDLDAPAARVCQSVRCATPEQELSAAAQFAKFVRRRDPAATVGIVVPDLEHRYLSVVRQFDAEFGADNDGPAFNVAGGQRLSDVAIVRVALDALRFLLAPQPPERVRELIASPYLRLRYPTVPGELGGQVQFVEMARRIPVAESVLNAHQSLSERPLRRLPEWTRWFTDMLVQLGWTGHGAGSGQYQAYRQARDVLAVLRNEWPNTRPMSALQALAVVRDSLRAHRFAPETPDAPIQILGYLETIGLRFSALWVTGMTVARWPGVPAPNPLVPRTVQAAADVPRLTREQELTFARHQVGQWRHAADHVVFLEPAARRRHRTTAKSSARQCCAGRHRGRGPWISTLEPSTPGTQCVWRRPVARAQPRRHRTPAC